MVERPLASLLAVLPTEGGYFSVVKLALYFVGILLWAQTAAWVQRDTKKIRVPGGTWTQLCFFSGAATLLLWLLIPLYWISLLLFGVGFGASALAYVLFRNKRVSPGETVLTPAHLRRLTSGKSAKGAEIETRERTRIKDANGKTPPWPKEPEESAAYQALQDLMFDAIWSRASDVRLDVVADKPIQIVYRIDGVDRMREPIDGAIGPLLMRHFRLISGQDPAEERKPQEGRFRATIGAGGKGDKAVDVQVKSSGSTAGQRLLLKLASDESKFRLPDIGLLPKQLAAFEEVTRQPKGVVLITGPRASGVTSTLYAALRNHDAFIQNIHLLEVTKTMDVENISQHLFDSQNNTVTFGKRFRTMLRTEPDVCAAGDVPDAETAQLAAAAAKQGKKVYLVMTARDCFEALRDYIQAVGDPAMAAAGLSAICNQRLLRLLCTSCRRGYMPDPALLKKANLPTGENRPFYRPPNPNEVETDKRGHPILCAVCHGAGYLGRTGVFELLVFDDELRQRLAAGETLVNLKSMARKKGLLYLQEVALHKVYDGITSINEVLRVTQEKPAAPQPARAR